jgi:hypothetical protein
MVKFLSGPSVEQAAAELLHLLTSETSTASTSLGSAITRRQKEQNDDGIDLDQLSDEEVNSLLSDLLAKEEVGE